MKLEEFNKLNTNQAMSELFKCCGSNSWVDKVMDHFPFSSVDALKRVSDTTWFQCTNRDWLEAFSQHPKIGEKKTPTAQLQSSKNWPEQEQSGMNNADMNLLSEIAKANKQYEEKFGFIFIICATGKFAEEMYDHLQKRMNNDPEKEIRIAAEEQNKITHLRIDKLFT